jgi:stage II sporulation protein AA (anti-sigma F factor antagonist)
MSNHEIVPDSNEDLCITLQTVPHDVNCLALSLSGYINTHNSGYFHDEIAKLIDDGYTRLLFHCGALANVSSAGIGSFAALFKTVKTKGGDMALVELRTEVRDIFKLLGFGEVFTIKDDLEEGFALFQEGKKTATVFSFKCPVCLTELRTEGTGRFQCEACKAVITLDQWGLVSLG